MCDPSQHFHPMGIMILGLDVWKLFYFRKENQNFLQRKSKLSAPKIKTYCRWQKIFQCGPEKLFGGILLEMMKAECQRLEPANPGPCRIVMLWEAAGQGWGESAACTTAQPKYFQPAPGVRGQNPGSVVDFQCCLDRGCDPSGSPG